MFRSGLQHVVTASSPEQLRAIADSLRSTLLGLVLERTATINELTATVNRPKSTVAHHVGVLVETGLLRVVAHPLTRRVRSIEERFCGCRAPATPSTASRPASTPPRNPRCRTRHPRTTMAELTEASTLHPTSPPKTSGAAPGGTHWLPR